MAGVSLNAQDLTPIRVVKFPSRRGDDVDRWHIEFGEYDAGGGAKYPRASLFLSREEASELQHKLSEALA